MYTLNKKSPPNCFKWSKKTEKRLQKTNTALDRNSNKLATDPKKLTDVILKNEPSPRVKEG